MTAARHIILSDVSTDELQAALQSALDQHFHTSRAIVALTRRPSEYRTSFPLEEIDVTLAGGERLSLLYKEVRWESLSENARRAKPEFLYDSLRELLVYRHVLSRSKHETATFYGPLQIERQPARIGLFLEKVVAKELYQIGELPLWCEAARWLARFHATFSDTWKELSPDITSHLLVWTPEGLRRFRERAEQFVQPKLSTDEGRTFRNVVAVHEQAIERLTQLPPTLLHGEFYASNVLVDETRTPGRVCPIDWEMAGIGPGLLDLSALVAGDWTNADRDTITRAYFDEWQSQIMQSQKMLTQETRFGNFNHFAENLLYCRLHLAMQWLGWSDDWSPPTEHRHNWLGEAFELAERLGRR